MDDRVFELPEQFILAKQADLLRTLFKSVAVLTTVAIGLIIFVPGFATSDDISEPLFRNIGVLAIIGILYFALERGQILGTIFGTISACFVLASYAIYMESPENMQMMALFMIPVGFGGFLPKRGQFWTVFVFSILVMLFTCWLLVDMKGIELEYRSITTLGMLMTILAIVVDSLSSSYRESITTTFNQLKEIQAAEAKLVKLDQDLDNAVSERIRAESVTSQLARTGQLALEAAGATPISINPVSGQLTTSEEFFRRFGFDNPPATLSSLLNCIHTDDLSRFRQLFEHSKTDERIEGEFRVNSAETAHWMFLVEPVIVEPLDANDGRVLLQGIIVDITTRVLERERLVKEDHKANESQRLESLGMLAGAIAHDFNNLLHVIMLNADLARQDLTPDSKPATSIDRLMTTVDRAAELCTELLAYSGRGQFSIEPVRIVPLVHDMRNLLELSAPKGVRVTITDDGSDPICDADVTQLRQIIMNLVLNAGDAVDKPDGEIELTIESHAYEAVELAQRDFIESVPPGDYVSITVRDNGPGMSENTRIRMFDPFFSTKETGHGLGLSAALGIVRSHNGTIEVTSPPGDGTTISFLLPAVASSDADFSTSSSKPEKHHKGVILFADDEVDIRQLAKIVLEEDGYEVIEAEDGQHAISLYREHVEQLQLVILDLMMPNKTGIEAYMEIRQIDSSVPVVFSSGFNESDALQNLPEKARSAFLKKPYLAQDLRKFVRELVGPR